MQPDIIRRLLPNWGATYGPSTKGPFPGIVLLHGSEGGFSGWTHRTAVIFAAHGYLCYPHSYSTGGNAWNSGSIEDVDISRTADALSALRGFEHCSGKVAVYGVSRGAEHALLLSFLTAKGSSQRRPDAVACLAAPDVICGAFDARRFRDSGDPGWQVWDPSRRAWLWNGSSDELLPTMPIDVETFEGPMFLSVGTNDQTWSSEMTARLQDRREKAGLPVEAHYYTGEGHVPGSEGENMHHALLLSFFRRTLAPDV